MNLKQLLAKGRGPTLEFLAEPSALQLAQQIVAFANALGGTILVGMDSEGCVYQDAVDYLEPAYARALRMCLPPFRATELPEWQTIETPDGAVVAISVKPSLEQLSVEGRDVLFRSGADNLRLPPEQVMERSVAQRSSFEDEPVPGATLDDLDEAVIDEYQRNRLQRGPRGEGLTRAELLRDAGAVDAAGAPTHAGILLFGKQPHHFLPQAGVVIVRFRGTSLRAAVTYSERYMRRVEVIGPAARLIERTWEVLFEEIHQQPVMKGLERHETYEYPFEAVREAVVTAICHRDYTLAGQRVEIRLFDDHMEIMSPGGLPGPITLDNILEEHYSRNPRLVRGLYYWGYIEELGQGMDIIYEAMRRGHHPAPELKDTGRSFTVVLANSIDRIEKEFGDELNPRQLLALQYLSEHDQISNRQYRELCPDVTAETLRLDLRDLVEKGLLLKVGAKRGTYYVRK